MTFRVKFDEGGPLEQFLRSEEILFRIESQFRD